MTTEEAIEILEEMWELLFNEMRNSVFHELQAYGEVDKFKTAFDASLEALKAEPCEDVVSRQAVLDAIVKNCIWENEYNLTSSRIKNAVEKLPPVTSKPRTGKWTKEESIWGWDGKSYQCSECGRSIHLDTEVEDLTDYPYCHCGAKMVFNRTDDYILQRNLKGEYK